MTMQIPYQRNNVKTLDEKILITLFSLQEKYEKPYSFPSQQRLLIILETFYGLKICRRTLNYHLRFLELQGFLTRKRRLKRLPGGTLSLATSLYFLTARAYSYLKGICRFVTSLLKKRPSWVKQFQLKDKIKTIQGIPDKTKRRSKYLETIQEVLT